MSDAELTYGSLSIDHAGNHEGNRGIGFGDLEKGNDRTPQGGFGPIVAGRHSVRSIGRERDQR